MTVVSVMILTVAGWAINRTLGFLRGWPTADESILRPPSFRIRHQIGVPGHNPPVRISVEH